MIGSIHRTCPEESLIWFLIGLILNLDAEISTVHMRRGHGFDTQIQICATSCRDSFCPYDKNWVVHTKVMFPPRIMTGMSPQGPVS